MADGITDSHNQDSSEIEDPMTSTNELETNIINPENNLIEELAYKQEEIASLTTILDNTNKEIEEFQKQIFEMRKKIESDETLFKKLSSLIAKQEIQLMKLKKELADKQQVISSFAVIQEISKKDLEFLQKQIDELKAKPINENEETLIVDSSEKIEPVTEEVSILTNNQNETKIKEEKALQKAERKAKKKMLKQLLKENPTAIEEKLAILLGVDSSKLNEFRKDLDI